jgi:prepilin-type N-terminal cleavage/methylation domain-containing protein
MVKIISHGRTRSLSSDKRQSGFSMVELLVVVAIIVIMLGLSLPYLLSYRKLYRSEDQALKVMDLMREASQLALNRRRTTRLEIDLTENAVHIIDENNADPDTLLKSIPLDSINEVRIDAQPTGVTAPAPPDYDDAVFADDTIGHWRDGVETSGNLVWTARFRSDGSVVNAANTPISATIYSWPPKTPGDAEARAVEEVRAITMFGGTGAVRYWKHNGTAFIPF